MKATTLLKMLIPSAIGIFIFFIPFAWKDFGIHIHGDKTTIFIDHISSLFIANHHGFAISLLYILIIYGGLSPFIQIKTNPKTTIHIKKQSINTIIFSSFKLFGLFLASAYLIETNIFSFLPLWIMEPKQALPFLFEKLSLSVGTLIPLGSLALTFLIGFGFLEICGVLMDKIMRPLFRTPGYSSIDAVTSFVGSYSIGLLITNKMYLSGKYSFRDAVITATGFSTVSATFMVIIANVLGIMEYWNFYFWSTFLVTFLVTAITAYIPPIRNMDAHYKIKETNLHTDKILQRAINAGILQFNQRPPLSKMLLANLKDGLLMSSAVTPSILAIGFTGMCIAKYTPFFEWLGYTLKPALWLAGAILNIENIQDSSGAFASGLAEMFLPSIFLAQADFAIKFMAAIISVSSILFFSGCIPCILSTQIPIKLKDLMIIWYIRTSLSIIFSALIIFIAFKQGWIIR